MTSVLVEGLDGTGKTTAVAGLVKRLNAELIKTPSELISGIRNYCVNEHPRMREGFYMVGNFMCSETMRDMKARWINCVIDRYYPSTYSYLYGKDMSVDVNMDVQWPDVIQKPDHSLVLILDNDERIRRLAKRGGMNPEEVMISQHPEISERINAFYIKFGCTPVYLTNDDSPDDVLDKIMAVISKNEKS